jgi:hypothetical protein
LFSYFGLAAALQITKLTLEETPMGELKTTRPFQQRFLDGYDRSQLRQEVQAVRPQRFSGLKKKYISWALGASLAFGGIGVPMAVMKDAKLGAATQRRPPATDDGIAGLESGIVGDLKTAQSIAEQVKGGVESVVGGVASSATAPLTAVAAVASPEQVKLVSEKMREQFFKTEVPFGSIIYKEATKNGVKPELVAAVVQAESRFKPTARSHAGAIGLMQLVPRTGKWMGARDLTNPAQNIAAGTKYLRYLNDRFDGNETKMIAAYNAGEGNVRRFGGVPPFRETRNYVSKVRDYQQEYGDRVEGHVTQQIAEAR